MSIITISRGSYSRGKEVAEKLAEKLGYECISRDVLIEASNLFNVPEFKLIRAIHDAPSLLERYSRGKDRYIADIRAAFLRHMQQDNIVYHGLAGQYFVQEIPHVLKVRILADIDTRVAEEMKRENISAREARYILKKDDDERRKWGRHIWGIDPWDPNLYNMVLHIGSLTVEAAVELIHYAVNLPAFQPTEESRRQLADLALAAQVEACLVEHYTVSAMARDGKVCVTLNEPVNRTNRISPHVESLVRKISGISDMEIRYLPH